jgi:hypothetical protein
MKIATHIVLLSLAFIPLISVAQVQRPNIVVIMTDDQTLESLRVMQKTRTLIGGADTTFSKNYASFPLCCPSRATFLTGQWEPEDPSAHIAVNNAIIHRA